jgi:phenylpropionate dioxygenase-like ring-hydroxylating dioxygenase large terminal subunit
MPDIAGCGPDFDKSKARMASLARVEAYEGFVFASMKAEGITLAEHLGRAKEMIDQLVRLSPTGRIRLSAGWLKHRTHGNWKNVLENQVDGYHAPFVHGSLAMANRDWAGERDRRNDSPTVTRDLGMGHSDVDYAQAYKAKGTTLRWTGNIPESRAPRYVQAMVAAYGDEVAKERLTVGPPHAMIFPNLSIAEMNIMVLQPVTADETIHWTTPVLLDEGHEINERSIRRCEGALGPAGLLIADDAEISELNLMGTKNRQPEWIMLARGIHDETRSPDGTIVGGLMDETSQRAFWRHYRAVMTGATQ